MIHRYKQKIPSAYKHPECKPPRMYAPLKYKPPRMCLKKSTGPGLIFVIPLYFGSPIKTRKNIERIADIHPCLARWHLIRCKSFITTGQKIDRFSIVCIDTNLLKLVQCTSLEDIFVQIFKTFAFENLAFQS